MARRGRMLRDAAAFCGHHFGSITATVGLLVIGGLGIHMTGLDQLLLGFPTDPSSCSAGVDELKTVRDRILAGQPGTTLSRGECLPSWDEPGRYVDASVTAAFSCEKALAVLARIYGRTPRIPPPAVIDNTDSDGPFVEKGDMRYYLLCDPPDDSGSTRWITLTQLKVPPGATS